MSQERERENRRRDERISRSPHERDPRRLEEVDRVEPELGASRAGVEGERHESDNSLTQGEVRDDPPVSSAAADTPDTPGGSETAPPAGRRRTEEDARRWRAQLAWGLGITALVILAVWVAAQARIVSIPLLVAFAVAYILDPVVDWFERRGVRRTLAIFILLVGFVGLAAGLVLIVGPRIVEEARQLPDKLRQLLAQVGPWVEQNLGVEVPHSLNELTDALQSWITEAGTGGVLQSGRGLARAIYGGTATAVAVATGAVLTPIFAFLLLRNFDDIIASVKGLIPEPYRHSLTQRFRELDGLLSSFVRGQLLVAAILAVLYSVGLAIVGLPLAVLIGVIAGLGNMIPYVGTAVGLALATLMALLEWQGIVHLLLVYLVFVVVQALEGWVITPRVVGESVGLSPFLVIIAVLVFGDLLGFLGVLIAVPLAAAIKLMLRVGLEHYRRSAFYRP